jgi:hypothetical protein
VLNIGHVCGKRWIVGLDAVIRRDAELGRHEQRLIRIKGGRAEVQLARDVHKAATLMTFIAETMAIHIPDLASSMSRIASGSDENRVERTRRGIDGKREIEVFRVVGADLFRRSDWPNVDGLKNEADYALSLIDDHPEPEEGWAKKIDGQLTKVKNHAADATRWLDRSRPFFSAANYAVALQAAGVKGVKVVPDKDEGDRLVTEKGVGFRATGVVLPS